MHIIRFRQNIVSKGKEILTLNILLLIIIIILDVTRSNILQKYCKRDNLW